LNQYFKNGIVIQLTLFRPEIAALRALAVAIVVFFHLKIGLFRGGFIGVDVFFVISGYLITRNILIDVQAGTFALKDFYVRRTRRIFPALIFTVAITYLLGALWCSPLMFLDIAKECTHALLSIANIQYWRESHKYFAAKSDQLALLHTWSLSAEEQFYVVWPCFLIFARRVSRDWKAIGFAAILSLIGAFAVARSDTSAVFFLTPLRIYEFCFGALVIFVENKLTSQLLKEVLSALGIVAIVLSAVMFQSSMVHLELAIVVPCLGAAAVILAGGNTVTTRAIAKPPILALGKISYSLYLCHWPIIFFARFVFGDVADTSTAT
jgi:peptidoglycan/LPS O-acetylase OafA/YrhL